MISIEINQTRLTSSQRLPKALLNRVAHEVTTALRLKQTRQISVAFVSEKEMRKLNLAYRGADRVTDVLSFGSAVTRAPSRLRQGFGGQAGSPKIGGGDECEIILSYEQAKRQAKTMKHSVRDELTFLLVHGLLHVFGFDHEHEKDAKKMFSLQTRILKRLEIDPTI